MQLKAAGFSAANGWQPWQRQQGEAAHQGVEVFRASLMGVASEGLERRACWGGGGDGSKEAAAVQRLRQRCVCMRPQSHEGGFQGSILRLDPPTPTEAADPATAAPAQSPAGCPSDPSRRWSRSNSSPPAPTGRWLGWSGAPALRAHISSWQHRLVGWGSARTVVGVVAFGSHVQPWAFIAAHDGAGLGRRPTASTGPHLIMVDSAPLRCPMCHATPAAVDAGVPGCHGSGHLLSRRQPALPPRLLGHDRGGFGCTACTAGWVLGRVGAWQGTGLPATI